MPSLDGPIDAPEKGIRRRRLSLASAAVVVAILLMKPWPAYAAARGSALTISVATLSPAVALIAGFLILLIPRLLNFIVAIYLIVIGLIGILSR